MTESLNHVACYPIHREHIFDPPEALTRWAEQAPIHPLTFPDGHEGWLVTGYAAVREILADRRFSARPELVHSPFFDRIERDPQRQEGFFIRMDPPEHTRYRRLLAGEFTVRRMMRLEPRIKEIVTEHLDRMELAGPPVDLVQAFALPIPSLVICELLGVPYADREKFQRDSATMLDLESTPEQVQAAVDDLLAYLGDLVTRKREHPEDDLLSVIAPKLTLEEAAGVGLLLLVAGHETTANMLGLGTLALLANPDQLAVLRGDAELIGNAVEELLRYLTIVQIGLARAALEDVEIAGTRIRAGQTVLLMLPTANRDPERFPGGDALDLTRPAHGHLAFGHGIHQCLGQQLARLEMRIAYPALFERFPGLRLAVPVAEIPLRTSMVVYGVHRLPVTW
ncbi:cytochrome P450 [Thermobispora bispora]|jgi:cytochrome P450|uniref:cytochrome P450 n=1 Tax=Thermobispora bispora TaxID=2006 RepID=UPI00235349F3|nr:cytochrome P450 [Actinomycetales bacterium]MBX6168806.1 cytochrome P450 [Thermobispora bispora]MDI9581321.1 cytochrome P450 [Thermobispora sp.]